MTASNKVPQGTTVAVRVKDANQLFDFRDPSPFAERELDEKFVEYLISSTREHSKKALLRFEINIAKSPEGTLNTEVIESAIKHHFHYHAKIKRQQIRIFLRRAQFFLLMGLLMLVVFLSISHTFFSEHNGPVATVLREGLVIFGWVSLWRPIEALLYDWYPLYEEMRDYNRLFNSEWVIEI